VEGGARSGSGSGCGGGGRRGAVADAIISISYTFILLLLTYRPKRSRAPFAAIMAVIIAAAQLAHDYYTP